MTIDEMAVGGVGHVLMALYPYLEVKWKKTII